MFFAHCVLRSGPTSKCKRLLDLIDENSHKLINPYPANVENTVSS